ncbi:hypothetical protein T4E_7461 [Trichinella pseudospiralis]|uniref:Uncharacterized protein n=1 Tax=Trichinella pseudospiralis TaxID=6337 RepID=A0A0V0YK29_TRIPS|nr:hypothetical protein T4E_7461 [Trichinella pseudospiralis]
MCIRDSFTETSACGSRRLSPRQTLWPGAGSAFLLAINAEANGVLGVCWQGPLLTRLLQLPAADPNRNIFLRKWLAAIRGISEDCDVRRQGQNSAETKKEGIRGTSCVSQLHKTTQHKAVAGSCVQ